MKSAAFPAFPALSALSKFVRERCPDCGKLTHVLLPMSLDFGTTHKGNQYIRGINPPMPFDYTKYCICKEENKEGLKKSMIAHGMDTSLIEAKMPD